MVLLTYISCCAGKEELEKLEEKEESNESGKFKEADEETLKKRRIIKAKGVKKSTDDAKHEGETKKTNPFANIQLAASSDDKSEDKSEDKKEKTPLEKLQQFYKKFNPTKIDTCEKLIKKYEGNEEILFDKLFDKYGTHPDDLDDETTSRFGLANAQPVSEQPKDSASKLTFGSKDTNSGTVALKLGEVDAKTVADIEASMNKKEDTGLKLN